jgi:hypothetical protein
LDDLALFDEIDRIKTDSIILPASPDVPLLPEDDFLDADNLWDLPALVPTNTEDSVVQPGALRPARRNLARAYGSGAVTRARARASTVTFADGPRNDDTTVATATCTTTTEAEVIFNAQLQSDPQPNVPKNYKDLVRRNDPLWIQSLNDELENFIKREAWELILRSKLPKKRRTLRTQWIFKEKADRTKKSRNVVRGYEQEPGVDFVESFSPLATNTTIKVVLATVLEQEALDEDWISEMVDVEAAFLNAHVDTEVYIEMPEGLKEYYRKSKEQRHRSGRLNN